MWLAPEGGPYSLWFAAGAEQTLANWITPPALNDGAFQIVSGKDEPNYRLSRRMKFENAARTQFDLEVTREINLQKAHHFGKLFGSEAQSALSSGKLRMVGFQTINTLTNRGPAMDRQRGLLAIWSLGQFPAGPRTFIILPYKGGQDTSLGPIVNGEYFGRVPAERLRIERRCHLVSGRWKIPREDWRSAAAGSLGGRIDRLAAGSADARSLHDARGPDRLLLHEQQLGTRRSNRTWATSSTATTTARPSQAKPAMGGFYELESLSPAAQLPTGKSLVAHPLDFPHRRRRRRTGGRRQSGVGRRRQDHGRRHGQSEAMNDPLAADHSLLVRVLEAEAMDSAEDARDYDSMDHSEVNGGSSPTFCAPRERPDSRMTTTVLDLGTGTAQIPIELVPAEPGGARAGDRPGAAHAATGGARTSRGAGWANRSCLSWSTPSDCHSPTAGSRR